MVELLTSLRQCSETWRSIAELPRDRSPLSRFKNNKLIRMTNEDTLEKSQRQQSIEARAVGFLLNARKSEERYFGQLERADPHILQGQGDKCSLRTVGFTSMPRRTSA